MRVCAEPGCPTLATATRCDEHRRERDRARGSATARGYGADHRALRASWQQRMDSGEAVGCWRCLTPIDPHEPWDLGHDDRSNSTSTYRGPEHRACNRDTASRR